MKKIDEHDDTETAWHRRARRMAREARDAHAEIVQMGHEQQGIASDRAAILERAIEDIAREGELGQRAVIDAAVRLQTAIDAAVRLRDEIDVPVPCICWPACSSMGADGCRHVCDHCGDAASELLVTSMLAREAREAAEKSECPCGVCWSLRASR